MAERNITVSGGQTVYDIAVQEYGTVENLFNFLGLNPDIDVNTILVSGQIVIVDTQGFGVVDIKQRFVTTNQKILNNEDGENFLPVDGPDFNNDFNEDYNI